MGLRDRQPYHVTHQDLSATTAERVRKELAQSEARLEEMIGGGYEIYTLSPPYGEYPDDLSLLTSGEYQGVTYQYSAAVRASGSSGPSPFSAKFDRLHIPRITAYPADTVPNLIKYFDDHPELRYVSDGDDEAVSIPVSLPTKLGTVRPYLDVMVVRY
jgi:hypothetical protein